MIVSSIYTLLSFVTLATLVVAHPGSEPSYSGEELARRELESSRRHLAARTCAENGALAEYNAKRRAKRSAEGANASSTFEHANDNFTCLASPEVLEGPYYVNNEYVRGNLSEDVEGLELTLDIGVIDIATCKPIRNAFVEIWNANATGVYGGYPPWNDSSLPWDSPQHYSGETYLRGGLFTDHRGEVELVTKYPGFYANRPPHVHIMVHLNSVEAANHTIISHSGSVVHVGQLFFHDSWNDRVLNTYPYTLNTYNRTYNYEDEFVPAANADRNAAMFHLELLGKTFDKGLLGFITIGVNSSASYDIQNGNYLSQTPTPTPTLEP